MSDKNFDFERFQKEAIQGLYDGKPLTGEKGIFAPLLKHFLESALEGELSSHLLEEKAKDTSTKNRRNGKGTKRVKSLSGEFELETPRDRNSSYEPLILPKRQVIISEGLEEKVIALYAMGHRGTVTALEIYLSTLRKFTVCSCLLPKSQKLPIKLFLQ